ncbi:hypothetical protein PSPO01_01692 [Paraphaeosphaeria sporulosa]
MERDCTIGYDCRFSILCAIQFILCRASERASERAIRAISLFPPSPSVVSDTFSFTFLEHHYLRFADTCSLTGGIAARAWWI